MTDKSTSPFTMVGAQQAAVCVDGVCEVPRLQESASDAERDVQEAALSAARAAAQATTETDLQP